MELVNPERFAELGVHVQVNRVPVTFEVNVMLVATLLHCCLFSGCLTDPVSDTLLQHNLLIPRRIHLHAVSDGK